MERRTPVDGFKGAGLGSLALAAALAVGPMTAGLRAAKAPKAPQRPRHPRSRRRPKIPPAKPTPAKPAPKPAPAPTSAEQQKQEQDRRATATLNEAKQAYEQKNYPQSVAKYREFLSQFPPASAGGMTVGLAMSLAEMPDKDWNTS